jgi:hypothetical protein
MNTTMHSQGLTAAWVTSIRHALLQQICMLYYAFETGKIKETP